MGSVGPMPTVFAPTVPRPWVPSPYDAEFRRDPVTGATYFWNVTLNRWVPVGPNDQPCVLYVDPVAGNDADPGDLAAPVQRLQEAVDRLPPTVLHEIQIRFIDGGLPLVIDEQVNIHDLSLSANVRIIGNTRPAVLPAGPNVIAPNPGHVGDLWGMTVAPAPGWVPGSLVGLKVLFTAGPHTGITSYIIENGANNLIFAARPLAAYGPADGFSIIENLETIQQNSIPFLSPTMSIHQVTAPPQTPVVTADEFLAFEDITVAGDNTNYWGILFSGECRVKILRSLLGDFVGDFTPGSLDLYLQESMIWTAFGGVATARAFDPTGYLTSVLNLYGEYTGLRGALYIGERATASFRFANMMDEVTNPRGDVIRYSASRLDLYAVGVDGSGVSRPVSLAVGAAGFLNLDGVDIRGSIDAGIGPQFPDRTVGNIVIQIDRDPPADSIIDVNGTYGIDATGLKVHTFGPVSSPVGNGIAGMRLRKGGFLEQNSGILPTLCGPIPLLTEIDFDNRAPIVFTAWGAVATGLQTLCHQQ